MPKPSQHSLSVGNDLAAALPSQPKPWYKTNHLLLLNIVMIVPLISSASVGFDGAMMNGLQTVRQWREYFDTPDASILGTMNAVYPIGKVLGLIPAVYMSDRFGRKVPFLIGLVGCMIGAAIQAASQNLPMFIVARLVLGISTAHIAQPSPILITELAYPTHRGKITALYNTFYYLGAVLAAWSTYGTFPLQSTWSWRIPSLLQGALPAIQLAFLFFLPESPRFLLAKGRVEEARAILVKYHAGGDETSPLVAYEVREIKENIRLEAESISSVSYIDLIKTAPNRRRTLIAVLVGWFAQWNGIGVVSYYLTLVLNTIGITETADQALINGLLQIFNWIAAIVAGALMVDRAGRRTLFLISTAGMLVSYVIWTVLTSVFTRTLDERAGHAVVAFIFIYYFFYDIAWTPLLQAYPVEIFPYALRGRGLAVTLTTTNCALIVGQFVNPIAMRDIGWKYYIVFCCLLALLLVLVYFFFPETRGRTLEQIAEIFDGKNHTMGHSGQSSNEGEKDGPDNAFHVEEHVNKAAV